MDDQSSDNFYRAGDKSTEDKDFQDLLNERIKTAIDLVGHQIDLISIMQKFSNDDIKDIVNQWKILPDNKNIYFEYTAKHMLEGVAASLHEYQILASAINQEKGDERSVINASLGNLGIILQRLSAASILINEEEKALHKYTLPIAQKALNERNTTRKERKEGGKNSTGLTYEKMIERDERVRKIYKNKFDKTGDKKRALISAIKEYQKIQAEYIGDDLYTREPTENVKSIEKSVRRLLNK